MATRDLAKNSKRVNDLLSKIPDAVEREIAQIYGRALSDIRGQIARLYDAYRVTGEMTRAQLTQFMRLSGIQDNILATIGPYITETRDLIESASAFGFDNGFFRTAWAIEQASGVSVSWSRFSDDAVRAAAGIGGNFEALRGIFPEEELRRHAQILEDAFEAYSADSRAWISRHVREGIIKGDSVQKLARRIESKALDISRNSAERIARTETLRATGMGAQAADEEATDSGIVIREIWDATLDLRTRPAHAVLDGQVKQNGVFQTKVGEVPGPRRSGFASFDINCRCTTTREVEGYAPSVRRIRGEGLQPTQRFREWAESKAIDDKRFSRKYKFLNT